MSQDNDFDPPPPPDPVYDEEPGVLRLVVLGLLTGLFAGIVLLAGIAYGRWTVNRQTLEECQAGEARLDYIEHECLAAKRLCEERCK